jgi:hypothetical protein
MRKARQPGRVLLAGARPIGQHLVAADVEGAEDDGLARRLLIDAAIEFRLLPDIGEAVAHHEGDLGAVEPDAIGAAGGQMLHVDQRPALMERETATPSR